MTMSNTAVKMMCLVGTISCLSADAWAEDIIYIDEVKDPQVLEALKTIETSLLAGRPAVTIRVVIDADTGDPRIVTEIDRGVAQQVQLPINIEDFTQISDTLTNTFYTLEKNPTCSLVESGGDYYWSPRNRCP